MKRPFLRAIIALSSIVVASCGSPKPSAPPPPPGMCMDAPSPSTSVEKDHGAPVSASVASSTSLSTLSFMVGDWGSLEADGTFSEEHWTAARGKTMLGVARSTKNGQTTFFEFLRITEDAGMIIYFGAPLGKAPTPFTLKANDATHAVFENPEHDYPQRILYTLEKGVLIARAEGRENGVEKFSEWRWSSIRP